jgi:hypothetical protein
MASIRNKRITVGKPPKEKVPRADDFESVAKRLGADEDKARFEAKLGKIARAKTKGGKHGRS